MNLTEIKDPNVRRRIAHADASQNGGFLVKQVPAVRRAKPAKRLRQSVKPLMNQLETEFYARLERQRGLIPNLPFDNTPIRAQAKRYRLGNGIWYKPDFTSARWPAEAGKDRPGQFYMRETAWEVKGSRAFRGGFENLKVAASQYPEVRWLLVWKDKETGEWQEQEVLP